MGGPLPVELRERVLEAVEDGEGEITEIAKRFRVDRRSIYRWIARKEATGSVRPSAMGGARPQRRSVDEAGEAFIRKTIDSKGALTVNELVRLYETAFGVEVHPETMRSTLHRLGYTFKKGHFGPSTLGAPTSSREEQRSTR